MVEENEETQLAEVEQPASTALARPDLFDGYGEEIDPALLTLAIPYMRIGQPQSKAVVAGEVSNGNFFLGNVDFDEIPPQEKITCVPCLLYTSPSPRDS